MLKCWFNQVNNFYNILLLRQKIQREETKEVWAQKQLLCSFPHSQQELENLVPTNCFRDYDIRVKSTLPFFQNKHKWLLPEMSAKQFFALTTKWEQQ